MRLPAGIKLIKVTNLSAFYDGHGKPSLRKYMSIIKHFFLPKITFIKMAESVETFNKEKI